MEAWAELWNAGTFVVEPIEKGRGHAAVVKDGAGAERAASTADGTIQDLAGSVLLGAPMRRARKPSDVAIDVATADGQALGEVHVTKYRLGPRARSLSLALLDPSRTELARLEPRDDRGEALGLSVGGADAATVRVEQVKAGFLRKTRVYTAEVFAAVPEPMRPLALAAIIRYDAMLKAVTAASMD